MSDDRTIETAGPALARIIFGWDGPMWRYRHPWGPWIQGVPHSATALTKEGAAMSDPSPGELGTPYKRLAAILIGIMLLFLGAGLLTTAWSNSLPWWADALCVGPLLGGSWLILWLEANLIKEEASDG